MTLREAIHGAFRRLHDSPRTEEAYLHWIWAFIAYHGGRHPRALGPPQVTAFLHHLAVERHASASPQNQALCALLIPLPARPRPPHARPSRPRTCPAPRAPPCRPWPPRGHRSPRQARPSLPPHRRAALRQRPPPHGGPPPSHQRRRPRPPSTHRPPGQGRP